MALLLRDQDVDQLVTMDLILPAIEDMQRQYGEGHAYNLPRRIIMTDNREMASMGGGLFYQDVFGAKTYTVVQGGYAFHVSLYNAHTGQLLAFLQANRLGQLRTGATTGLAVKYLARQNATSVGIIGSGAQAGTQLEAICKVRGITQAKVYSPNPERRHAFAMRMSSSLGITVTAVDANRDAVAGSDIVDCIANNTDPVVLGEWLSPGVTVVGAGPTAWRARELDEAAVTKADRIYVDSLEQAAYEAGDLASAVSKGLIQWEQMWELRRLVAGFAPGRRSDKEVIYAKLMGTGVADVAAAKLAYDLAKQQGIGTEIEF